MRVHPRTNRPHSKSCTNKLCDREHTYTFTDDEMDLHDERIIRATIAWFDDHGEYLGHYESIIDYDAIIATAEEPE